MSGHNLNNFRFIVALSIADGNRFYHLMENQVGGAKDKFAALPAGNGPEWIRIMTVSANRQNNTLTGTLTTMRGWTVAGLIFYGIR